MNLSALDSVPLVGRATELGALEEGLTRALGGHGSTWAVTGPGGMGKTRLLRTLEDTAIRRGFKVRWGYCLKESLAPFFPFQQIFQGAAAGAPAPEAATGESAPVVLFEEEKARRVLERACVLAADRPLMVLSRDRPVQLRQRFPALPATSHLLWLTRNESPDAVAPGAMDALAERLEKFLQASPRAIVVLIGLEYLVSQNAFLPVLRLVQALRDTAEATGGQVFLSLNTATMENREVSLLEAEAEVVREEARAAASSQEAEPPALRLLRYLETLQRESRGQPQLLLLDDLQWADPQSRLAFQFIARNGHNLPLMVVGALREETEGAAPVRGETSLAEILDHLDQEGGLRRLALRGLGEGDAKGLAEGLLHVPLDLSQGDRHFLEMLERTGGNPYFLLESLHQLVDEGFIQRKGSRAVLVLPSVPSGASREGGGAVPIPASLKRLVARRLEAVSVQERAFLDAASIVGSEFDLPPLEAVLGKDRTELAAMARDLDERHRLVHVAPGSNRISFAHPLVWEVLRDSLDRSRAADLAHQFATWWTTERSGEVDTLARLSYEAGDREGGLRWIGLALEHALAASAGEVAVRYIRWRRELITTSKVDLELRARLEMPLIERLTLAGSVLAAQQLAEELMGLALDPPLRWEVEIAGLTTISEKNMEDARAQAQRVHAELLGSTVPVAPDLLARSHINLLVQAIHAGDWAKGAEAGAAGLSLPNAMLSPDILLQLQVGQAWCLKELRQIPAALALLESAERLLPRTRSGSALTRFYNAQGAIRFHVGDLRGAKASFRAASEAAHAAGNVLFEVLYQANEGTACWSLGEYVEGLRIVESASALAEKFDLARGKATLDHLRAILLKELGRYDEAEVWFNRSLASARQRHDIYHVNEVLIGLAYLKARRGDAAGALPEILALAPAPAETEVRSHADYLMELARCRTAVGDLDGADKDLDEARRIARANEHPLIEGHIDIAKADIEKARGHEAEERRWRSQGEDRLRALGVVAYLGRPLGPKAPSGAPTEPPRDPAPPSP